MISAGEKSPQSEIQAPTSGLNDRESEGKI